MIRTYCFNTEKDWDEGVHLLLFAARESVQESLGFSPFELVFGHTVRGPLKLLQEKFISSGNESLRESPAEDHAGKSTVHITDSRETWHTFTTSLVH